MISTVWLSDLLPLVEAVFLELPGLDRDLSVCLSVHCNGDWLSGIPLLFHSETSTEEHHGAHADTRPYHLSQGWYCGEGFYLPNKVLVIIWYRVTDRYYMYIYLMIAKYLIS